MLLGLRRDAVALICHFEECFAASALFHAERKLAELDRAVSELPSFENPFHRPTPIRRDYRLIGPKARYL